MKVSVIVPVFNGADFISDALDALLSQTLNEELEIIIVNDGSTDGSQEIIDSYVNTYPNRIVSIEVDNGGAAQARNLGLEIANGEYIGFMDCDDMVDLTMFEKLYCAANEQNADIATCGYYRIDRGDVQRRDYVQRSCFGFNLCQAPSLLKRNVPYIWNKLFRKSFLEDNNFRFDEDLDIYEDLLFTYKAFLKANKIIKVSQALYSYVFSREGSLTYEFTEKRFQLFMAFERLIDFYRAEGLFFHAQDELLYIFLVHVFSAFENDEHAYKRRKSISIFYKKALIFLNDHFPYWKNYDTYFNAAKRNRFLVSKNWYVYLLIMRPTKLIALSKDVRAYKKRMRQSKAGLVFKNACRKAINNNKVLIDSQRGVNLNGNMFYLLKELLSNRSYGQLEIFVTFSKQNHRESFIELCSDNKIDVNKINFIKYNSRTYAKTLASSKYIFTDTSMPVYFIKRNQQIYVNTWHGTPLKHLGRDMEVDYHRHGNLVKNFLAADYLVFQNRPMNSFMEKAYMYGRVAGNKVVYSGYPRNEIFFRNKPCIDVANIKINNQQRIAYMPTWRGHLDNIEVDEIGIAQRLNVLDESFTSDQIMFVKLHPYDRDSVSFDNFDHIYPFPAEKETYEFLSTCDVLVTDYSSVMFDYSASEKPIILYVYDEKKYLQDRGLYMRIEDLELPIAHDEKELIREIKESRFTSCPKEFVNAFNEFDNEFASQRLCSFIFNENKNNKQIEIVNNNQNKTTLLFTGDFADISMLGVWIEWSKLFASEKLILSITYDNEMIHNFETLKKLDQSTIWLSRSFPFSATTAYERWILLQLDLHPQSLMPRKTAIRKIMEKELSRSFPNVHFERVIVYSGESLKNILLATYIAARCELIVTSKHFDSIVKLPRWVIERFDCIVVESCLYKRSKKVFKNKIVKLEEINIADLSSYRDGNE